MARQPDDSTTAKISSEDSALIRELALLLDETSLTEIEIERAGLRVRVARNITIAASMPASLQPGERRHYNRVRPQASLGYRAPAPEVFVPTLAAWPAAPPQTAPPAMLPLVPRPTLN